MNTTEQRAYLERHLLNDREWEVIKLGCCGGKRGVGLQSKEIAAQLGLAPNTIKEQFRMIYDKLTNSGAIDGTAFCKKTIACVWYWKVTNPRTRKRANIT